MRAVDPVRLPVAVDVASACRRRVRPRSTDGPKFEYGALVRNGPTDATLMTLGQEAGVCGALVASLPAAATTTTPWARTSV